jgi:SAM-dependent methyltransferase
MIFNDGYTQYWRDVVNNPIDGLKIADKVQVMNMLKGLSIQRHHKVLDLGCSYGRLYDALSFFSDDIYGVDPEASAVQEATSSGYKMAKVGACEDIPFTNDFFDQIVCWAVFEVVDQQRCLVEANRTLRTGGRILISGKNARYLLEDDAAFIAEKNAYLKGFRQSFTDLQIMVSQLSLFGFKLIEAHTFPKRGDLALDSIHIEDSTKTLKEEFYEFVVVLEKMKPVVSHDSSQIESFSFEFSKTCEEKVRNSQFDNAPEYLKFIGID